MTAPLAILQCSQCGGDVALGDGDSVRCPFCSTTVEIPPAHRELRDAERADARERGQAGELFARYGARPRLLLRVAAVLFHPVFLILDGLFILLMAAMMLTLAVGDLLAPLVHANLWDTLPDALKGYGLFFIAAGSVLGGMVLGIYGRRRLLSMRSLQAALAARPPKREGGDAACRECGAPLHVPGGATGVRCIYCRTDNLVAVPREWIAGLATSNQRIGRAIEEADAWLREEHRRIGRSLRLQLGIAGGVLGLFIGFIAAVSPPTTDWRPLWSEYAKEPRTVVFLRADGSFARRPLAGDCAFPASPQPPVEKCEGGHCRVFIYAPLGAGESVSLRSTDAAPDARVRVTMHSHFWWGKNHDEGFGRQIVDGPLLGARFTAPWSAWYQVRVDDARALCFEK